MFFADRIKSIKPGDRVLEIGPGSTPHQRSDVLLEKEYDTSEEYAAQLGHNEKLATDKTTVYYKGDNFPFKDKEFDYVICSHVLEHVDDPEHFLSEIFRVAGKGYLEYPLFYYEYLYNFKVHANMLKFDGDKMYYVKKNETALNDFLPVQQFFYDTLQQQHVKLIDDLLPLFMEGFEWHAPFEIKKTTNVKDLTWKEYVIPSPSTAPAVHRSAASLAKELLKKVIRYK